MLWLTDDRSDFEFAGESRDWLDLCSGLGGTRIWLSPSGPFFSDLWPGLFAPATSSLLELVLGRFILEFILEADMTLVGSGWAFGLFSPPFSKLVRESEGNTMWLFENATFPDMELLLEEFVLLPSFDMENILGAALSCDRRRTILDFLGIPEDARSIRCELFKARFGCAVSVYQVNHIEFS